ncbi:hypothetical protein [Streptomyces sp. CNQ085]|uniref:hypothetical protein n=1 Tax=Streptomyces sp. CNQ085 TaxID=2886944 RepID=UPI001F510F0B|nr:hypothetical protein [Streptomyces sp. CNQ085]MCI0386204.1 hypothetical protein [Streptomyces sp. CNQ085]
MSALIAILASAAGPAAIAAGIVAEHLRPPSGPARTRPALDTCAAPGCLRPVPTGATWCGWPCRNLDDRLYGGDDR